MKENQIPKRLPNGKCTYDVNKYIKSWRDFARPICEATGSKLHAFDPSIQIRIGDDGKRFGTVVSLPNVFVEALNKALQKKG